MTSGKKGNCISAQQRRKEQKKETCYFFKLETLVRLRERSRILARTRALRLSHNTVIRATRSLETQLYKLGV